MPTVYASTLRRAAKIVGGLEALAAQLDVRPDELKNWLAGKVPVPQEILRCVDIVVARQLDEISGPYANRNHGEDH